MSTLEKPRPSGRGDVTGAEFWAGVTFGGVAVLLAERYSGARPPVWFCVAAIISGATIFGTVERIIRHASTDTERSIKHTDDREG